MRRLDMKKSYKPHTIENVTELLSSGKKYEDFSTEDWEVYTGGMPLDEKFIEKYEDKICWFKIGYKHHKISKKFITKYSHKINWINICIFQKMSESFILKHHTKVIWPFIIEHQKLSEQFLLKLYKEFRYFLNYFIQYQNLSEEFIEKYQDELDWNYISFYQKLSESFIERNFEKLCWDSLIKNKKIKISKNFLLKIYKEHKYELFDVLKLMPGIKQYSKLIEKQIPKLLIEIEN